MYKIIMLPQPILVSEKLTIEEANFISHYQDVDGNFFKIIAGLPDLPKLDLSLIAEEIGWVDVEKLADEYVKMQGTHEKPEITKHDFIQGFIKAAQSLNEKKYSEEDIKYAMFQVFKNGCRSPKEGCEGFGEIYNRVIQSLSKPKEYQVEVEMGTLYFDGTRWVDSLPKKFIDKLVKTKISPKITNNTIKILRTI